MVSFPEAVTKAMRDNFCSAMGVLGDAITLGSKLTVVGPDFLNLPNALGALVCDLPPDNLEPPPPEFTGGQCVGKAYNVVVTGQRYANNCVPANGNVSALGAIGPISTRRGVNTTNLAALGGLCPGVSINFLEVLNGSGQVVSTFGQVRGVTVSSVNVTPVTGLDNCGNIPPVYPPPGNTYNFGDDITYNVDDSTQITVPITGIFAPITVAIDGSLRIPLTLDVGGVEFTGNIEVSPNFTVNIQPKGITTGPGEPDPIGGGGGGTLTPVPEDGDDEETIIGVLVFSTIISDANSATGFASLDGPDFYVPRLGSVQFAIKTGNSIGWTADQDVKNLESYVPCPAPQGAIAVRVTPIAGVTRTFIPVRAVPLTSF